MSSKQNRSKAAKASAGDTTFLAVGKPSELDRPGQADEGHVEVDLDQDVEGGEDRERPDDNGDWLNNLAETLSDSKLATIGRKLVEDVERDIESRAKWDEMLAAGMEAMGFDRDDDERDDPFPGASAVRHPLLPQSFVDFNSRVMKELFPATGPVDARFTGESNPAKNLQASRVRDYGNYLCTSGMPEYREETDKLMFWLPLAGSIFRKASWQSNYARPLIETIWPLDFVAPYSAKSLETTPRATHIMRLHEHEVEANIDEGLWRDVPMLDGVEEVSKSQETADRVVGLQRPASGDDDRFVIYEVHVRSLDVGEGFKAPYIVSLCSETGTVLAIRRNWEEHDDKRHARQWFIHYKYCPWFGFYGAGLWHMIGGQVDGATGSMRALMDSAAFSTLPGGLKQKGPRGGANEISIRPGEWVDVDMPPGVQDISKVFSPIPVNQPSTVLMTLLQFLVDSAKEFATVATQDLAEANEQAPVGTTLALVEQKSIVFSQIHMRQHQSLSREFEILRDLLYDYADEDIQIVRNGKEVIARRDDFDGTVAMVPVSDPDTFSDIQRKMQAQARLQLANEASQKGVQVDFRTLYMQAATDFGLKEADKLFPAPPPPAPPPPPLDPVSEFGAVLQGRPVLAQPGQNHPAHIQFHTSMLTNPAVQPALQPKMAALMSLISDHAALAVRDQIEQALGHPLPPPGAPVPPQLAFQIAQAAAGAAQQAAQHLAQAQQPPGQPGPDLIGQAQMQEVQRKAESERLSTQVRVAEIAARTQQHQADLEQRRQLAVFNAAVAPKPGAPPLGAALIASGIQLPGAMPGILPPPPPPTLPGGMPDLG